MHLKRIMRQGVVERLAKKIPIFSQDASNNVIMGIEKMKYILFF